MAGETAVASLGAESAGAAALGPIGWAGLGLQAVSMGASYYGQKKAEKKAKQQAKADAELMRHQAEVQTEAILAAKTEAEKQTVQNMSLMARQAMIQRGRIIAGAGEAGVAGGSVSGQLLASYQQEAEARGTELYNLSAYRRQANRDIAQVEAGLTINLPRYTGGNTSAGATILASATQLLSTYQGLTRK